MQYRELTTRVIEAGLGVVTFSEDPASDADDNADERVTREQDDPSDSDDDGVAYRASLPTLLEVPDKPQHRQS